MVVSVLEEMRIRSLGVIDDAVVELSPGFTAVTGETGAGKTMVVTSLGLLLGDGRTRRSCGSGPTRRSWRGGSPSPRTPRSPYGPRRPGPSSTTGRC
ncbi:hypothetical protein GCM10020295_65670 [Streptomyces cinereospinus]